MQAQQIVRYVIGHVMNRFGNIVLVKPKMRWNIRQHMHIISEMHSRTKHATIIISYPSGR